MSLTRRGAAVAAVAYLYLESLAVLSVAESEPAPGLELDRRSLRHSVHVGVPHMSPSLAESRSRTGGGGLGVGAIIGIVVSSVCLVGLMVAVAVVMWRKKSSSSGPRWELLRSFKRRNPEAGAVVDDEDKLYAQAKGDTHLSGF